MKNIFVLLMLFFVIAVAQGQRGQPVEPNKSGFWSTKDIKASIEQVKPGERPAFSRLNRGNHSIYLNYWEESRIPESHAEWNEIWFIQYGEGTLVYGGKLEGAKETRPGELKGGKIVGGTRQKLVPGDIVTAPAGMPHQWLVEDGKTFGYVTVKVAKQEMP